MKNLIFIFCFLFGLIQTVDAQNYKKDSVNFDLLNESSISIPLVIEGLMKPNLSPFSRSGVSCKVGTKIWTKGKKELLLVVTEDLQGESLIVNKLIKELSTKKRRGRARL